MLIKLNKTSKMNCFSFSLDANLCNIGSKLRKIKNSTCSKCYALKGNYHYPSVKKNRQTNMKHLNSSYFVFVMSYQLKDLRYFRWFDSGDIPSMKALLKIVKIAKNTPKTKHWLPTREFGLIKKYLKYRSFPQNLLVRLSAPMIDGTPPAGFEFTSTVHNKSKVIGFECLAPKQNNNCLNCRSCWSRKYKNISYREH